MDAIIATFKPQYEEGRYVYTKDEDEYEYFDVTLKVLSSGINNIHAITDDSDESDNLVDGMSTHSGPFKVEIEESLCEYFGVDYLEDITQAMVDEKITEYDSRQYKLFNVEVTRYIKETVMVQVSARSSDDAHRLAINDLDGKKWTRLDGDDKLITQTLEEKFLFACRHGSIADIKQAVEMGVDIHCKNSRGRGAVNGTNSEQVRDFLVSLFEKDALNKDIDEEDPLIRLL